MDRQSLKEASNLVTSLVGEEHEHLNVHLDSLKLLYNNFDGTYLHVISKDKVQVDLLKDKVFLVVDNYKRDTPTYHVLKFLKGSFYKVLLGEHLELVNISFVEKLEKCTEKEFFKELLTEWDQEYTKEDEELKEFRGDYLEPNSYFIYIHSFKTKEELEEKLDILKEMVRSCYE